MWTVQKNSFDHKIEFPEAAKCVIKSTIVDDHLDSCPTAAEAIKVVSDLVVLYKKIGLKLAKVTTNNAEVLENLPEAVETSENMKDFSQWGPQEI
jgi:chaperonin cofactor prefoldin